MFNRTVITNKKFERDDYIPLADRGWDGEIEVMSETPADYKPNYGRMQGKKKRSAMRKQGYKGF